MNVTMKVSPRALEVRFVYRLKRDTRKKYNISNKEDITTLANIVENNPP